MAKRPAQQYPEFARDSIRRLGESIRLARRESGLTQIELADSMGVSPTTLSSMEAGAPGASVGNVALALFVLGLPMLHEPHAPEARGGKTDGTHKPDPAREGSMFDFGDGAGPVPAHKHPNGGGWVADTAEVADTAFVGPDARVYDTARVSGFARVSDQAQVSGNARVTGFTQVSGFARVHDMDGDRPAARSA